MLISAAHFGIVCVDGIADFDVNVAGVQVEQAELP